MSKAIATWRIELNVNCPHCDGWIDLMDDLIDDWDGMPSPGESKKRIEKDVECPLCKKEFTIDAIEF